VETVAGGGETWAMTTIVIGRAKFKLSIEISQKVLSSSPAAAKKKPAVQIAGID